MEIYTMIDKLQYFFKGKVVEDTEYDDTYNIYDSDSDCLILKLVFDEDNIYIKELEKCSRKGTDIIQDIILFANTNDFKYIQLEDQSALWIDIKDEDGKKFPVNVDLATLNILATGQSWYNRLGFKQYDYKNQLSEWNIIRNKTFRELIPQLKSLTHEDFINKGFHSDPYYILYNGAADNIIQEGVEYIIEEITKEEFLLDEKVKDVASLTLSLLRNNNYLDLRLELAYIHLLSYLLNYDRDELTYKV